VKLQRLRDATSRSAPEVPWASVAGLRDLIAHEYFRIEMSRIIEVVERDIPKLSEAIDCLLIHAG
jgi:uncharacterized protein with HEPN domain